MYYHGKNCFDFYECFVDACCVKQIPVSINETSDTEISEVESSLEVSEETSEISETESRIEVPEETSEISETESSIEVSEETSEISKMESSIEVSEETSEISETESSLEVSEETSEISEIESSLEVSEETSEISETESSIEVSEENSNNIYVLKIETNGNVFYADFEDNSSAEALKEKLNSGSITINMHDYGNFEKVGELPFSLVRNDEYITTSSGDVILYQGNQLTIYYDTNSWNFTRVAKIRNADSTLKNKLGEGNIFVTLSLEQDKNVL